MGDNNTLQSAITRLKQQTGIFSHAVNDDILSDDVSAFTDITEEQAQEITRCCDILEDITDTLTSLCNGKGKNVQPIHKVCKRDGTKIRVGYNGYMRLKHDRKQFKKVTVERIINHKQIEFSDENGRHFVTNKHEFETEIPTST